MPQEHDLLTIRFCGDSGDGIQLIGHQLMLVAALHEYEVRSLPDFPAEIRAPLGTIAGVSGIQLGISGQSIETAGDGIDILVALNPAALLHSLSDLNSGAKIFMNSCQFAEKDWQKAKGTPDIIHKLSQKHEIISVPILQNTLDALQSLGLNTTASKRCKNFYVLGIFIALLDLSLTKTLDFIARKFAKKVILKDANQLAVSAGYNYAITQDWQRPYFLKNTHTAPGTYRQINGAEAVGLALATLATHAKKTLLVAGYPITPSSAILHECAKLGDYGVELFQAEDEIAAVCACLGAAFGGHLALTTTSGPGFDLKMEGIGLGVVSELPMVILDVQRAGASTGLPTKTSQSDMNQALYGRHGESPLPVIAAQSPSDCFATIIEAFRIAIFYMTPVIVLLDAYLMNASEPWEIPDVQTLELPDMAYYQETAPYKRLPNGARSWNPPGRPDYIHQIGGLEKQGDWGKVSYDAKNHADMVALRAQKIENIQTLIPGIEMCSTAKILIMSWGSSYGVMKTALDTLLSQGYDLAWINLKHIKPFPKNLETILHQFNQVLVFELNSGHLSQLIRAKFLIDAKSIQQINGKPFSTQMVIEKIKEYL